jgi:hypothetical protein
MLRNILTILGALLKCFGLPCMGCKCLRSELFKMDENLAFCDILAEKLRSRCTEQGYITTAMIKFIFNSDLLNPILLNIQFC